MLVWSCLERAHRRSQPKSVTPDLGLEQYDDGGHDEHIADSHLRCQWGVLTDSGIASVTYSIAMGWAGIKKKLDLS